MEQGNDVEIAAENLDDSSNSPLQKKAKCQPEEKLTPFEATSNKAPINNGDLMGDNQLLNQQPTNSANADNQQSSGGSWGES